ncbi:hypothetical protein [Virgibacillus doumboii]|uniref:hypothetical protein n=1 Tax=Virgibacillus doumboii TaxID=2697503 RepID=UPI0013DEEFE1|nr:hypothetical protein [Virgibacillus doumboii]
MRKLFILILIIFILGINIKVSASSYETLEPQEVVKRADIIVIGKYNFNDNPEESDFIYSGYEFDVERVLKGEATTEITAGIDMYDVSMTKDFQEKGGKFLLLLEHTEFASYPTPVVAQNGMVKLINGKVDEEGKKRTFYEDFIDGKSPKSNSDGTVKLSISVAILGIASVSLVYFRRKSS